MFCLQGVYNVFVFICFLFTKLFTTVLQGFLILLQGIHNVLIRILQCVGKAVNVVLQDVLQGCCKTFKRVFKVFARLLQSVYNVV